MEVLQRVRAEFVETEVCVAKLPDPERIEAGKRTLLSARILESATLKVSLPSDLLHLHSIWTVSQMIRWVKSAHAFL